MSHQDDESTSISRILISGAGFLADAYDLFVINVVVDIMNQDDYYQPLTKSMKSNIKTMALIGAVVGQIGFGATADLIGRRKVFIMTCSLVIIGALLSATVQNTSGSFGIYSQLCLWRFVLGVGVGGEYPLSASITAESSQNKNIAKNLASVFSMQGFGTILCSIVLVTVTSTLGTNYNAQWRIALALGALPMVCAFYFRWKMHETSWKDEHVHLDAYTEESANANIVDKQIKSPNRSTLQSYLDSYDNVVRYFSNGVIYVSSTVKENKWALLGTAGSWFILDVVFYANGLFSGEVTKAMGISSSPAGEAVASLILNCIALPGYFCTVLFINRIGARNLQLNGFAATCLFFMFLAVLQPYLIQVPALYIIVYGATFFFQNFGANATTYIIPSIVYTTSQRATCHGLSAAAGKLGAIVGAEVFLYLQDSFCSNDTCNDDSPSSQVNAGLQITFFTCASLAFIGWLWTYYLVKFDILNEIMDININNNTINTTTNDADLSVYSTQAIKESTNNPIHNHNIQV